MYFVIAFILTNPKYFHLTLMVNGTVPVSNYIFVLSESYSSTAKMECTLSTNMAVAVDIKMDVLL